MSSGSQLPNLDKIFREDDETDFLPSDGSSLAAIFGNRGKARETYSATKQQSLKKSNTIHNPTQTVSTSKTEVIIAKAVHAFKLQNGMYAPAGKLGIALTGNISTKVYQIILYKNKQEYLSVVTVKHDFLYTVQPNNYSSYYDSNNDNWSILFDTLDVCIEFAREIGLARYFSKDSRTENVFYQDLTPVSKDTVAKEGDNINIKYYINTDLTQPFKSNIIPLQTMSVTILSDDNWERILLGAGKGLRRILFLPPSKQISLGPGFPKDKDIVLEVEIIDIVQPEETLQLPKVGGGKASIISRMAKMGQSMLPKLPTSNTTDSEDTEDDVPHISARHKNVEPLEGISQKKTLSQESFEEKPKYISKTIKTKIDTPVPNMTSAKSMVSSSTFLPQWSPTQQQPNYVTMDGQVYSLQQQTMTPVIPPAVDPGLNMLLSENRMTNAELRMGMSKIADNVQKLLDKFHVFELQNATTPTTERTTMDAALKMFLAMNTSQVGTKNIESQKGTDGNNINNNNLLEMNEIKSKLALMEKELRDSKETLINREEYIKDLEVEKNNLIHNNEGMCTKIQELETSLQHTSNALSRIKQDFEEVANHKKEYEEKNAALEDKICKIVAESTSHDKLASSLENKDIDSKNKEIKHIMNRTYHTLLDKFVDEAYSTDYIKSTIATTIKNITLQVLYKNDDRSDRDSQSSKISETDSCRSTIESEAPTLTSSSIKMVQQIESPENIMNISAIRDEPPPIPPNDTEMDNEWLQ